MASIRELLEVAITELTRLIDTDTAGEQEFQSWFERHPVAWEVIGFERFIPHPTLSAPGLSKMVLDFLAQRPDGLWEIVELKRPDTAVLKNPERRTTFYSDMNSYVAQCHEYSVRCSDSVVVADLLATHGVRMNGWPHSIIIAGRSLGLDRIKVHELIRHMTPKISHYTYDDVLDALNQHHTIKQSEKTDSPGLTLLVNIGLSTKVTADVEYLFDLGSAKTKGRVSLVRKADDIVTFVVIDDDGLSFTQDVRLSNHCDKDSFICGVRTAKTHDASLILLEINGSYVGQHEVAGSTFTLEQSAPFVLGADMHGSNTSVMFTGRLLYLQSEISIADRSMLREYMFEDLWPRDDGEKTIRIRYRLGRFLHSIGHPILDPGQQPGTDMIQKDLDLRPSAVEWVSSNVNYTEVNGARVGRIKSVAR